jgi:hypothetical protein
MWQVRGMVKDCNVTQIIITGIVFSVCCTYCVTQLQPSNEGCCSFLSQKLHFHAADSRPHCSLVRAQCILSQTDCKLEGPKLHSLDKDHKENNTPHNSSAAALHLSP